MSYDSSNVFARLQRREIPAQLLHDDEHCIAFPDAAPRAPLHLLVVPKRPIRTLGDAAVGDAALLGHLLLTAAALAKQAGHPEARIVAISRSCSGLSFPPGRLSSIHKWHVECAA